MKKICFVLTTDMALKAFLVNHLRALAKDHALTVVVNTQNDALLNELDIPGQLIPLAIARQIHFARDIACLWQLIRLFSAERFDVVHSVTPKAGLLSMLAAWFAGVPIRIHTFTGQVWANKRGIKRFILKTIDRLLAALTTHAIIDSPSQRDFLLAEHVIRADKAVVFELGSISGVDTKRFQPSAEVKQSLRAQLQIPADALVFLFLGRLNADKGVLDLAQAFIQANLANAFLLFVGPDEQHMQGKIAQCDGFTSQTIRFIGLTDSPQTWMACADVLCLPSYREGFGSVIIEAASCGLPAIASCIYGITDALVDQQTGLLHPPGDIQCISQRLTQMAEQPALRYRLATQAQSRARTYFASERITLAWQNFYRGLA